ncbi:hypothetical protein BJ875DRAFT_21090 [Amylocarpus encephaloides]|uniref:Uncharacterized protein n=1 Tax=Amylocarpus encephaloides TaxID=45428 RepID=A0A9P7YJK1_9HELO|nr:hypothetical protein BJ875DRAFT_21090 [Amylocarpus encephaloides]
MGDFEKSHDSPSRSSFSRARDVCGPWPVEGEPAPSESTRISPIALWSSGRFHGRAPGGPRHESSPRRRDTTVSCLDLPVGTGDSLARGVHQDAATLLSPPLSQILVSAWVGKAARLHILQAFCPLRGIEHACRQSEMILLPPRRGHRPFGGGRGGGNSSSPRDAGLSSSVLFSSNLRIRRRNRGVWCWTTPVASHLSQARVWGHKALLGVCMVG